MTTQFKTVGPATLSYDDSHTPETVLAGIVVLHRYLAIADRFTGSFSPDDQGNVRDWATGGQTGGGDMPHYVCTLTIDAGANRGDVLTAVAGLAGVTPVVDEQADVGV
jgi:hypothetical protein